MALADSSFYLRAIEKSFLIADKNHKTVPFILNEPQAKILSSLKGRDIILKARQEGISSLILALFTIDFISIDNIRCVVICHEQGAAQRLFDRVKFYLESLKTTFPGALPYKLKYNSRSELVNTEKNSTFYIGSAGATAFGRGDTIHNLHLSEFAMYQDQEKLMISILQAVPKDGRIIIESTAQGVGNYFHNLWKKSKTNEGIFTPHFLPWFNLKEYSMPIKGSFMATPEEVQLQQAYNLTNEQLHWRRWKIKELNGNEDAFAQEFPANDEEAFIVSGNPIWSPTLLKKYMLKTKPARMTGDLFGGYEMFFEENPKGNLKLWKPPLNGHRYCIGADVAEGIEAETGEKTTKLDQSCAYVMDKNTAEIVACLYGSFDGDVFGRKLEMLGRFYNMAYIGVERNFQGLAPLVALRDLNYPSLYYREKLTQPDTPVTKEMGWKTDRYTRPLMVEEGTKWLREERINIYDPELVGEMMSFVRYPDGQGRAAQGAHDDRVMSFLLTIQMYLRSPHDAQSNPIEGRTDDLFGKFAPGEPFDQSEDLLVGETDFVV